MLIPLLDKNKQQLLEAARSSIAYGLENQKPSTITKEQYPEDVYQQMASTFVTLKIPNSSKVDLSNKGLTSQKDFQLRGCIGSLTPFYPLIEDVTEHAYAAAFKDHRFPNLQARELPLLHISISLISPQQAITFNSEIDLLKQIRPGIDGLTLECNGRRATFLPSVWEQLSDKVEFITHLKQKAGFSADFWSEDIEAFTYQTVYFEEPF